MKHVLAREIPGAVGPLEALLEGPEGTPRVAVVLAHPHPLLGGGGTMHTKAVYQAAKGLLKTYAAVLRFNFRGVGHSVGTWDEGAGEQDDMRAALDYMAARYPGVELWAGGMSFGAWVALTVGAADLRVEALIGIAPPVGLVDRYDFSCLHDCTKPKFFVQGNMDEVCPIQFLRAAYATWPEPKELVEIDGANHLFEGQAGEVAEAMESLLGDYSARTVSREP